MKIYTRMGDGGETGLLGGRRLPKTDPIFALLGNLDETNAAIGLATSYMADNQFPLKALHSIQSTLLNIGACIANDKPEQAKILEQLDQITDNLERQIDEWNQKLPRLQNFILPEGKPGGAMLHFCRTLVRQTERSFHLWPPSAGLNQISRYLNRLSDYFFQAARYANFLDGHTEQIWHP
jgi:cob(I)alamin adenosyltransferase